MSGATKIHLTFRPLGVRCTREPTNHSNQTMKKLFATFIAASALAWSAQAADLSAKVTDVHLCCQSCVKGVEKAVAKVPGASVTVDQDDSTVTLTGPDAATVQKSGRRACSRRLFRQKRQRQYQDQCRHWREECQGTVAQNQRRAPVLWQMCQSRERGAFVRARCPGQYCGQRREGV